MIKIVVDSTGYIEESFAKETGIEVIPLKILIGGKEYKEGVELSTNDFYKLMKKSDTLPKTSQPSLQDFLSVYKPIIENGDSIISIHISEIVSGTINTARMAKDALNTDKIKIIDSKSTTFSIRYLAEYALSIIKKELDFDSVYQSVEKLVERLFSRFVLNDIKYLVEGGRLSRAEGLIGNLLNIKPILSFTDGVVKTEGLIRTWKKAKEALIKFAEKIKDSAGIEKICVIYGENVDEAREFIKDLRDKIQIKVDTLQAGAVIGTYGGPQWFGIGIQTSKQKA